MSDVFEISNKQEEKFEVWFDDSKTELYGKQPPLPPLSPEQQIEHNKRLDDIFEKYAS